MWYILTTLIGMTAGALCAYLAIESRRLRIDEKERKITDESKRVTEMLDSINANRVKADDLMRQLHAERNEFEKRVVSYQELQEENAILKRDLRNFDVLLNKTKVAIKNQDARQTKIDEKVAELGERFLKDSVKWIGEGLTTNNFATSKQRLLKAIEWCREIGLTIHDAQEASLQFDLKAKYELLVRAALEREEQARIKAQIREEQAREREIEKQVQQLDRERDAIKAALEKALAEAKDEHNAEVERLRTRLMEAEERSKRAVSQAQLTKAGHVYVISNLGSFGDSVFKIGMTRRLEPLDRIRELGDASVPFPFDVHMMISCDDAPTLENALHRAFHDKRLNKTNPRKEFFRIGFDEIIKIVEANHGQVSYVADAEALEFRQSESMSEEDQEYIESVFDSVGHNGDD